MHSTTIGTCTLHFEKERPLNCSRTIDSLIIIIILFPPNFDEVSSLNRKTCRFHVLTLYRCHEYLSGTHPVSRNILSVRSNPSETQKPCYRSNTVTVIGRKKTKGEICSGPDPGSSLHLDRKDSTTHW